MATSPPTPAVPSNVSASQGSGNILIQWNIVPGATSYIVQRSTDPTGQNPVYTTVSSPTTTQFLDIGQTYGITLYYQVAAVNSLATVTTSGYSPYVSATPSQSGEMSLGELRLRGKQRADRVNSNFVTDTEWNYILNQSYFELYDLLIDTYEDYYLTAPYGFTTNGSGSVYPLPDGRITLLNYFTNVTEVAPAFYKLWGVDLAANTSPDGWVTMNKYNPLDRNKYYYPNSQSTIYGVFNAQYRLLGSNIEFIPIPSGNQFIRLRYFPRLTMLLADSDLTNAGISGWLEYVIIDAAIKALTKEESDTTALTIAKADMKKRIEAGAKNRDAGRPDTIQDTRSGGTGGWNTGGYGGFQAGW